MGIELVGKDNLSKRELSYIKNVVTKVHISKWVHGSIDSLEKAVTTRFCGIRSNGELSSFSWLMMREFMLSGISYNGMSVGLVTTMPEMQGKGYGRKLMESIERLSKDNGCDFVYLAGIPGFYERLGYQGFAPKSKIVFRINDLEGGSGTIKSSTGEDKEAIIQLYRNYTATSAIYSVRKEECWEDLHGDLSESFLFYKPMIVRDKKGKIIAYFCSTPGEETIIREFVTEQDTNSAVEALRTIAASGVYKKEDFINIYSTYRASLVGRSECSRG